MSVEQKLAEFGYTLIEPPPPAANYIPIMRQGDCLYISGQISAGQTGVIKGHLGSELNLAQGQKAAAHCAVNILAQLKYSGGFDLQRIRMIKLTVLVASVPHFTEQHLVANGASDLLVGVLGVNGRHARAAFGVVSLPLGAAVEIAAVAAVLT